MFVSIRRYETSNPDEVTRRVTEAFVPVVAKAEGFVAYYVVETGKDEWSSVSIFNTEEQAERSNSGRRVGPDERAWLGASTSEDRSAHH